MSNDPYLLKQIIISLEDDLKEAREENYNELAQQQFTGYAHAISGYSLIDLIENMGLGEEEWIDVRVSAHMLGLTNEEIAEINRYFGISDYVLV